MAELLSVPLKKSTDVDIVKPLKNLLQSSYSSEEKPEDFSDDLNELSRLRTAAIWKVFENSSLDVIYNYHDQLVALESKVPPQEVQIPFKWKDAFDRGSLFGGRMSLTISSLAYERACVSFNVAALQSQLAAQQPLDSEESLKLAAKLLQQAAGAFAHLKASVLAAVHQEPTPDLQPDTLDALHRLMLAQAQEVIAYKCMRDQMKDSMVAKVCAAAEDMYADAARAMAKERVRALWERDWAPHVAAKQAAFRGLAQLHQANECKARGAVGEEIARLQLAAEALAGARGRAADASARAARRLAAALKDNDFIYHERVPPAADLEAVARAPVARATPPPARYADRPELFAALVPARAAAALAAAASRRAELAAAEVARLRDATQLLNSTLASLGLPAAVEARGGGSLPESVARAAAEVRAAGGAAELRRLMRELPELLRRNTELLDETERQLREEAEADAALRAQFGARWARTPSPALTDTFRRNADKYRQIVDNAVRADDIVRDKFKLHEQSIELLSGDEAALRAALPADAAGAELEPAAAEAARALLREVERLKAERDALETELKDARVDLRERLLAAPPAADERQLAEAALHAALQPLRARVDASLREQDELAERLREAAAPLARAPAPAPRAAAFASLAAAHDAFRELRANLTEGTKFYNDLTQLLVAFQNKVGDFCFARKTEKEELLKDLTQEASRAAPEAAPSPRPAPAPPAAAAAAPALPYPAQPQGMPVPYGGGAPYPYVPAPMPALYNPYATLPYPHHAPRMPPAPPSGYLPYQHPPAPQHYPAPPPGYNPYPQQ